MKRQAQQKNAAVTPLTVIKSNRNPKGNLKAIGSKSSTWTRGKATSTDFMNDSLVNLNFRNGLVEDFNLSQPKNAMNKTQNLIRDNSNESPRMCKTAQGGRRTSKEPVMINNNYNINNIYLTEKTKKLQ